VVRCAAQPAGAFRRVSRWHASSCPQKLLCRCGCAAQVRMGTLQSSAAYYRQPIASSSGTGTSTAATRWSMSYRRRRCAAVCGQPGTGMRQLLLGVCLQKHTDQWLGQAAATIIIGLVSRRLCLGTIPFG
jgi:hypothetical protein